MNQRTLVVLSVVIIAGLLLVGALVLLDQQPQAAPEASDTPSDPAIATVEGHVIRASFWAEQYALDQVMSRFAGQAPPSPSETLDRLVNEVLLLSAYPIEEPPTTDEVTQRIETLKTIWNVQEPTLTTHLQAAGISRQVFTNTINRLLKIEAAQEQLSVTDDPVEWITQTRQKAKVNINENLLNRIASPPPPGQDNP